MPEETDQSKTRHLEKWTLGVLTSAVVFFGGKWIGRVDSVVDSSPAGYARLARVEERQIADGESLERLATAQMLMLKNQLEMNQFIAKEYGNTALAKKFEDQLKAIKVGEELLK